MFQLYIEYGSVHLDFQDAGCVVRDGFYPEIAADTDKSISERFDLIILGATSTALETWTRNINLALEHARRNRTGGDPCWLYYSPNSSDAAWRARVLDGQLFLDAGLSRRWKDHKLILGVSIEREPYWDGPEAQLALTNANGTDSLDALPVYNCNDGSGTSPNKRQNYADVAASDIAGDLPAACRLELTNTYASLQLQAVWVGLNYTDPDNFTHTLEAESAVGETGADDTSMSGGKYISKALLQDTETQLLKWTLSAANLSAAGGRWFHFLMRYEGNVFVSEKYRLKLLHDTVELWKTGQVCPQDDHGWRIRDLFSLRLPPWLVGLGNLAGLNLVLTGEQNIQESQTYWYDFAMLIPADGFRCYDISYPTIPINGRLVDDGFLGLVYQDNGAGLARVGAGSVSGSPLLLYPGRKHRLYFLMHANQSHTAEVDRTLGVKLYYRPRRRAL